MENGPRASVHFRLLAQFKWMSGIPAAFNEMSTTHATEETDNARRETSKTNDFTSTSNFRKSNPRSSLFRLLESGKKGERRDGGHQRTNKTLSRIVRQFDCPGPFGVP